MGKPVFLQSGRGLGSQVFVMPMIAVFAMTGCSDDGRVRVLDPVAAPEVNTGNNQTPEPVVEQQPQSPQVDQSEPEANDQLQQQDSQLTQTVSQPTPVNSTGPVNQTDTPTPPEFLTGQTFNLGGVGPSGGIVYFLEGGGSVGNSGIEAAPNDAAIEGVQERFGWGCDGGNEFVAPIDLSSVENLSGSTLFDSNSGSFNSAQIISGNCTPSNGGVSAAQAAVDVIWPDGTTGGFLPNREELLWLRDFVLGNSGGVLSDSLLPGRYWSSSEVDATSAWTVRFDVINDDEDVATISNKFNFQNVRAVRSF